MIRNKKLETFNGIHAPSISYFTSFLSNNTVNKVKPGFSERDKCKPVLLRLSFAGNLEKLMSLYETEWRERGYGLRSCIIVWQ